jgi:predicted subunit of tRNA(5-methylaminomethyl-2-thiouridylate) methyltransferase
MKSRLLAALVVLAIIGGAVFGMSHLWRKPAAVGTEAQAVLQIPRDLMASSVLFERTAADEGGGWSLSKGLAEETLNRLKERSIPMLADSGDADSRASLIERTLIQVASEAGEDRVTITYRTPLAEEAIPVLSALVDTVRDVQPLSSQQGEAAEVAERESQISGQLKRLEAATTEHEASLQSSGLSEAERVVLLEQIKSLGVDLAEARRDRLEAEHRYLQTRKDLEAGLPVDVLISRLPGNESQDSLRKLLSRPRVQEELQVEQAAYRKLASTYGPKHPRMLDLTRKIETLEAQAKSFVVPASAETRGDSTSNVLLRLLAADLEERQSLEADIQEQFDVKKSALDEQAGRVAMASRMHKEATRLQEERETARRKIVELRRHWQEHATEVLIPPGFVEASLDRNFTLRTAGSASGAVFLLGALAAVWWRGKPQSATDARKTKKSFSPLDKFRDQDDRATRLARLKSLGKDRPFTPQGPLVPQNG